MLPPSRAHTHTCNTVCVYHRYFHREIKLQYDNPGNKTCSIFSEQPDTHRLVLKDHISIHLYLSTVPAGDANAFTEAA